jgi:PDZ domain-containing protein
MYENGFGQPAPPGARPVKGFSFWRIVIGVAAGVVLVGLATYVPIPIFYAYTPGPVRDIDQLVAVSETRTYSSEGSLFLTTVNVDPQVTLWEMVAIGFDPERVVVLRDEVTGGRTLDRLIEMQRIEMQDSKQHATEVALAALGFGEPEGRGARVVDTRSGFGAHGVLEQGDVIVAVDGEEVDTTCDVGRLVERHEIGDKVEVVVTRAGERREFRIETRSNRLDPGTPFLGVEMEDVGYKFEPGVEVDFETGKIGGPSAGLMMTLALYDKLTPDDLTGGRRIAGTGTIACDGGVGPIGGIEQKVAGAEREGAVIFLSPQANLDAAEKAADEIEVVAISNFDDAREYLENLE